MPITRRQFELGIDNLIEQWMRNVHQLLAANQDKAYSEEELKAAFGSILPSAVGTLTDLAHSEHHHPLRTALEKLIELDAIDARVLDSVVYYTYKRPLALD